MRRWDFVECEFCGSDRRPPGGAASALRDSVDVNAGPDQRGDSMPVSGGRFEQAFECSPIGMALTTLDGEYVSVNPAMCDLLGRSAANLLATSVLETTHPDDLGRTVAAAVDLLEGAVPSFSLEKRFLSAVGRSVWTRATTTLLRDDANRPTHFLTQVEDFEERRELMERLRQAALHDPLTGLANRAGLEEFVDGLPDGMLIGVLALDLDRFKQVNDVAGHAAGDEVLRTVSRRILSSVGPDDHAARTGGDEFVVLCRDPRPERDVASLADRLITTIGEPICVAEGNMSVTASAGVAIGSVAQAAALRISADRASYQSKRRGGAIVTAWPH